MAGEVYGIQSSGSGDIKIEGVQAFGPNAKATGGADTTVEQAETVVQQPSGPVHTGSGDQSNTPGPDEA